MFINLADIDEVVFKTFSILFLLNIVSGIKQYLLIVSKNEHNDWVYFKLFDRDWLLF